jgi:proteasome lid subunit RPN8/RPN11
MLRHLVVVAILAPTTSAADLALEAPVREMSWRLLGNARYGFSHEEQAAFVVRTASGAYGFFSWPSNGVSDSARWEGRLPGGVVAIIHTHPNWLPSPSSIDARTARTTGVPVYVITRTEISKTTGGTPEVVISGDWYSRPETPRSSE